MSRYGGRAENKTPFGGIIPLSALSVVSAFGFLTSRHPRGRKKPCWWRVFTPDHRGFAMTAIISHAINTTTVQQRAEDGYIHATAMCKAAGKLFNDYSRLDTTRAYLQALASDTGIPVSQLVVSRRGNTSAFKQGTWVHPKVAIHLAQWLSPEFAVQVSNWVFDWLSGKEVQVRAHTRRPPRRAEAEAPSANLRLVQLPAEGGRFLVILGSSGTPRIIDASQGSLINGDDPSELQTFLREFVPSKNLGIALDIISRRAAFALAGKRSGMQ